MNHYSVGNIGIKVEYEQLLQKYFRGNNVVFLIRCPNLIKSLFPHPITIFGFHLFPSNFIACFLTHLRGCLSKTASL